MGGEGCREKNLFFPSPITSFMAEAPVTEERASVTSGTMSLAKGQSWNVNLGLSECKTLAFMPAHLLCARPLYIASEGLLRCESF